MKLNFLLFIFLVFPSYLTTFFYLKVGAKDLMDIGDRICLPKSVDEKSHPTTAENQSFSSEEERNFVQSLELYKV